jgi:hypothetical protein
MVSCHAGVRGENLSIYTGFFRSYKPSKAARTIKSIGYSSSLRFVVVQLKLVESAITTHAFGYGYVAEKTPLGFSE